MSALKHNNTRRPAAGSTETAAYPLAGPVPSTELITVSEGGLVLRVLSEEPLQFKVSPDLGGVDLAQVQTTGFEGIGLPDSQESSFVESIPEVEAPASALTVSNNSSAAVTYDAIEFLEYDDPYSDPEPEPEVEPERLSVAPPAALETLPVPFRFAAPAAPKLMQGTSDVPMPSIVVLLPQIDLRTARRKMCYGENPNKPKPAAPQAATPIAAATAPAAPKQPPQVVVRSTPQTAKPAAKAPAEPAKPASTPEPKPTPAEKPKITVRPAASSPSTPPPAAKPAIAARERGNAVAVQREAEPETVATPAPKPKLMPIRKVDTPVEPAVVSDRAPLLGMATQVDAGAMSPVMKGALAAAVVVIMGLGGYFAFGGKSAKAGASPAGAIVDTTAPGMVLGGGGWTTTWGSDAPVNKGKQISIYRPSMSMTDYRLEFRGIIERKAMGWIFRASNPKNYYVMKLETIKPGANPIVALIKYAVVDGKETTRTQVMLPFERLAIDTIYSVRLDVKGDKFSTYVQNKLVDFWTDDRIKTGGTGFYNDKGERAQIKSSQVAYLAPGK